MPQNKNRSLSRYKQGQSTEERIISMIAHTLWLLITLPFRGRIKRNNTDALLRWQEVQSLMEKQEPTAWVTAILKADTVLNDGLKQIVSGESLGERLRNAEKRMRPDAYQSAWEAHKVRNNIAHEHIEISKMQADQVISKFRTALNNLRIL